MIDFEKAEKAFNKFLEPFDKNDVKVKGKIIHTFNVVRVSEELAKDLNLSKEDTELSKLIALLHDIGRFKQATLSSKCYDETEKKFDHGDYGVEILFNENLIREFIEDDKYDSIIYKAIKNHNKSEIEPGLSGKELLHAKLIRDNDKTENVIRRLTRDLDLSCGESDINVIENALVTDGAYNEFMSAHTISIKNRITCLDRWIGTMAFVFDYNFKESLQKIYDNDCINRLFRRINYKNPQTIERMEEMRVFANNYMENFLKS